MYALQASVIQRPVTEAERVLGVESEELVHGNCVFLLRSCPRSSLVMLLAAAACLCSVLAPPPFMRLLVAVDFVLFVQAIVLFGCSRTCCRVYDLLMFFTSLSVANKLLTWRLASSSSSKLCFFSPAAVGAVEATSPEHSVVVSVRSSTDCTLPVPCTITILTAITNPLETLWLW